MRREYNATRKSDKELKTFISLYLSGILSPHLICAEYNVDKAVVSNYKSR